MIHPPTPAPCVGVLYCGDLGAAVTRLLRETDVRVITTCAERSPATHDRARNTGAEIFPTLQDVVHTADVLISVVHPQAAEDVARKCANCSHLAKPGCAYVELNSIDVQTLDVIETTLRNTCFRLVDASIHGGAARLRNMGVAYLSGDCEDVARLFQPILRVRVLGDKIGLASRMKLLMAGQSKGLNMLFLEIAQIALKAGMLEAFLAEAKTFYPEILTAIERMLPTYPQHASRRISELESIEDLALTCGAACPMTRGARQTLEAASETWTEAPPTALDILSIVMSTTPAVAAEIKGEAP